MKPIQWHNSVDDFFNAIPKDSQEKEVKLPATDAVIILRGTENPSILLRVGDESHGYMVTEIPLGAAAHFLFALKAARNEKDEPPGGYTETA